jgi:autotransporter translocation and assembly factor TamB
MLVGPGAELVVRADDFELATLAPLLGRRVRDLRGRVDASVTVRGGVERPSLEGTLRARDGSLRVPVLRQTFEPIDAEIAFRDDLLRIERLRVGRENAHAELSGSLRLDAFLRPHSAELEIVFERFPASRSPVMSADLSGRALLSGPLDAPILRGALALSQVRVRLADPGDPALREIRVITSDAARASTPELVEAPRGQSPFDRARIDLELSVPRNSWVRGQGANLELAGVLQLDKDPSDALRISGDVGALRGTYRFQGRRFDVRRGTVSFDGGVEPDPLLDVEARRRVGDVVVIVTLSGRLSEPIIRLSSEPDLPEDDVLAYLFFGRPARELTTAGTTQAQLEAAAGAFAAGIAIREASSALDDLVPIDSFDVEMREDGRSADLSIGKYITDDVFVTYERRLGSDPVDGVRLHLRLGEHWSIATDAATDESAGADLIWSFDY